MACINTGEGKTTMWIPQMVDYLLSCCKRPSRRRPCRDVVVLAFPKVAYMEHFVGNMDGMPVVAPSGQVRACCCVLLRIAMLVVLMVVVVVVVVVEKKHNADGPKQSVRQAQAWRRARRHDENALGQQWQELLCVHVHSKRYVFVWEFLMEG